MSRRTKKPVVWAFCAYDQFPYVIGGRVERECPSQPGFFYLRGWGNHAMKPTVFVEGDAGRRLKEQLDVLEGAYHRQLAEVERRMCKAVAACFKSAKTKHPKPENLR